MVRARILRLSGAGLLLVGAFLDWTSSSDLGHDGDAFDVPLAFLWSSHAVTTELTLGHLLVAFGVLALVSAVIPATGPVATGVGAGVFITVIWYVVRFGFVTNVVDPSRALGAGLAASAIGGAVLVVAWRS